MKKILALVLTLMLVLGMTAALAADPVYGVDATVSVTDMMKGDKISLYQVLTWNDTANDFVLADGFKALRFTDGQTEAEAVAAIKDGITQAEANAIAAYTKTATAKVSNADIGDTGSYTYTLPADTTTGETLHSGLGVYIGVITAGTPKYVYNPVFVSADFVTNNDTGSISSLAEYSDTAVAKRKEITVDKYTADEDEGGEDITATAINSYVGQEVDFKVVTTIPVFMSSYKNPSFVIDDAIKTAGIELKTGSIKVKLADAAANTEYETAAYKVVENGKTGYTVTFKEDYLKGNTVPVDVVITYKGKITNEAEFNVNEDDNEVTVTYSNGPGTEKAALMDRTNHYTFSLGANIFGEEGAKGKTFELVKVGVDGNGKPVVEKKLVSSWEKKEERHPLAGAKFGLYTDSGCTKPYKNDLYPDGAEFTTLEDGIITFKGLAAGKYFLKEISAPGGYIADDRIVTIEITAEYKNVDVAGFTDTNGIKVAGYSVEVLESYTVKVNNVSIYDSATDTYGKTDAARINTYTYNNDGPTIETLTGPDKELDSDLVNTLGVELPHTGGMGTTILYIGGSILVLAAVILLVTKRRMKVED